MIVGVADFSNTLVGPPAVEIYRVLELLDPEEEFLSGYAEVKAASDVSQAGDLCLRLDAAVMITLVLLSEAPDPDLAERWIVRVRELYQGLKAELLGLQSAQ